MEDGYRLIDYGININDVIQLMIRAAPLPPVTKIEEPEITDSEKPKSKDKPTEEDNLVDTTCEYYEVKKWVV